MYIDSETKIFWEHLHVLEAIVSSIHFDQPASEFHQSLSGNLVKQTYYPRIWLYIWSLLCGLAGYCIPQAHYHESTVSLWQMTIDDTNPKKKHSPLIPKFNWYENILNGLWMETQSKGKLSEEVKNFETMYVIQSCSSPHTICNAHFLS